MKDEEIEQTNSAVKMLLYCSCLTMVHMDLVEDLVRESRYNHSVKYRIKLLGKNADAVYKECCRVFRGEDSDLCTEFGKRSYDMLTQIKSKIGFNGSEKSYQIICALSHLIRKHNKELQDMYYFKQAEYLYNVESILTDLNYKYNPIVELIITKI